jgi:serine/threonine protein phosphatase PrpC
VFSAFGVTDKGRSRASNEDCFAIHEPLGLVVVADGMGGHNAGEVASRMAVDVLSDYFSTDPVEWPFGFDAEISAAANRMRTAILLANVQILESAITIDDHAGMGTTVVAAQVSGRRLVCGHVGDSRLYVWSGGSLRALTADDSWIASMLAHDPGANPALLQQHPMRHALTNVVGTRPRTDVHVVETGLNAGDRILMTTDGVHEVIDDGRLEQLIGQDQRPEAIANAIVKTALARGSRDNLTAVVVDCRP